MSSHGKVLDLLDDRYLNLQDVTGNVRPFPHLVPYEEYTRNMILYRMNTKHEVLLALIQDFTVRAAHTLGKELWTWWIQWEVEDTPSDESWHIPTTKRLRTTLQAESQSTAQSHRRLPSVYTICERRCLEPALFEEADILRILADIVQVDSKLVPNYIEFLYQWIDYYEGDGKALKAALQREIPSLWEFDYHPVFAKKQQTGGNGGLTKDRLGEATVRISEWFTRKRPDITALERATTESERLHYREPKFGLQPPIDPKNEPIPPLINIPKDMRQRSKYYAACFKSRQRAIFLLQEAGVSTRQIANYRKLQEEDPRETPEDINGEGFFNYYKEERYAHDQFIRNEQMARLREKEREIAVSNRLALEAQLAEMQSASEGSPSTCFVPPPLIPPTPTYSKHPDLSATILSRMQSSAREGDPPVTQVPRPIYRKTKSEVFLRASATDDLTEEQWAGFELVHSDDTGTESGDDGGEEHESSDDMDSDGMDLDEEMDPGDHGDGDNDPGDSPGNPICALAMSARPSTMLPNAPLVANIPTFMQGLDRPRFDNLMTLFNNRAQEAVIQQNPMLHTAMPPPAAIQAAPGGPARHRQGDEHGFLQVPQPTNSGRTETAVDRVQHTGLSLQSAPSHINLLPPQSMSVQGQPLQQPIITTPQNPNPGPPSRLQQFMAVQEASPQLVPSPSLQGSRLIAPPSTCAGPPPSLSLPPIRLAVGSGTAGPADQAHSPLPLTPLAAALGANLSVASPQGSMSDGIPIQVYIPGIVLLHDEPHSRAGDCILLGYTRSKTNDLVFSKAILLPVGVWENTLNRVRKGSYSVIEAYTPPPTHPRLKLDALKIPDQLKSPHKSVYDKLTQVYGFMAGCGDREEELTKRWRCTMGPLMATKRGAVWEGWGVYVDSGIEMSEEERKGALVSNRLYVGGDRDMDSVDETRRKEIEELLKEELSDDSDEGENEELEK